jgi:hypothetical protein
MVGQYSTGQLTSRSRDAPEPRRSRPARGAVIVRLRVGGLHHCSERRLLIGTYNALISTPPSNMTRQIVRANLHSAPNVRLWRRRNHSVSCAGHLPKTANPKGRDATAYCRTRRRVVVDELPEAMLFAKPFRRVLTTLLIQSVAVIAQPIAISAGTAFVQRHITAGEDIHCYYARD